MSLHKGQTNSGSFRKGEHRSKRTEIKKGQRLSPNTEFGNKPAWNKGLKGSEYKKHYIEFKGTFKKGQEPSNKGKQKPTTPLKRAIRDCFKSKSWTNSCFIRDNFECWDCGQRGRLSVHHIIHFETLLRINNIKSLQDAIECNELWNTNNGVTLCLPCHKARHKAEGYRR